MIDKIIKIIRIRILFENDINFIYLHTLKVNLTIKTMLEEKNDNLQNNAEGNEQINHETVLTIDETSSNNAKSALDTIEKENAEENEENGTVKQEVPEKEYESLSPVELVNELNDLLSNYKITAIKNQVEEIKKAYLDLYNEAKAEKFEAFKSENPEAFEVDFDFSFETKNEFDLAYQNYRTQKSTHFNTLQKNLKSNLEVRTTIIDELKDLVDNTEQNSLGNMFNSMNELRSRWNKAGAIPKDKYNIVWNNYHFHVERFYDLVHLDKEARDKDFEINLEQKKQIIEKAKALKQESDVMFAFRELQQLHRIWKEEVGPVDRDIREVIWNEFSEITKEIHDKRELHFAKEKEKEGSNLEVKKELIQKINHLSNDVKSHNDWQKRIKEMESLRESFFAAGKVPIEVRDQTWGAFKNAVRNFNKEKNNFYKEIKNDQQINLDKKIALVEKAKQLQNSDDFKSTTPVMKQIQEEWKKIGHVPRKLSDKVWDDFKSACNHYFGRLNEIRDAESNEEKEALEKKTAFLENIKDLKLEGEHKQNLETIKTHISTWKELGRVPFKKRQIEGKFSSVLDGLFEQLNISKKETELMKFSSKIEQWQSNNDTQAIEKEQFFIRKKIDEVKSEIIQLENNIQFVTSSKKENPFLAEVNKSISRHKEDLETWKAKLKTLRTINV